MKKIILFCFIFMVCSCTIAFAKDTVPDDIRIGLYYDISPFSSAVSSFTISSETGMEIGTVDKNGNYEFIDEVKAGKKITIKNGKSSYSVNVDTIGEIGDNKNFVRIIPNDTKSTPLLSVNDKKYRGEIEIRRNNGGGNMTVINIVSMQDYLYGVVPREIGGNSPYEAVKAQAIIARTYACKNYNKRVDLGFNLTDTARLDQAYGGADWENKNSNRAVDETEGMVVTYDGNLINGYYFSTSGGYTENSENVWTSEVDYLKAVPDPYEPDNLEKTKWTVTYTASDVEKFLEAKEINIGSVKNMIINEVSETGRVVELEVIGTVGTYTFTKNNARTFLNLNSQWFTINDDEPVVPKYKNYMDSAVIKNDKIDEEEPDIEIIDEDDKNEEEVPKKPLISKLVSMIDGFKSSNEILVAKTSKEVDDVIVEDKDDDTVRVNIKYGGRSSSVDSFEIKGRGFGHAVGMSQNGAIGMANNDFTYDEIIKWYYKDVEIEQR